MWFPAECRPFCGASPILIFQQQFFLFSLTTVDRWNRKCVCRESMQTCLTATSTTKEVGIPKLITPTQDLMSHGNWKHWKEVVGHTQICDGAVFSARLLGSNPEEVLGGSAAYEQLRTVRFQISGHELNPRSTESWNAEFTLPTEKFPSNINKCFFNVGVFNLCKDVLEHDIVFCF